MARLRRIETMAVKPEGFRKSPEVPEVHL